MWEKRLGVEQNISAPEQEIRAAARSHIGASPLRILLEDRSRAERIRTASGVEMVLGVVADGIGGENAGERAAEITVNTIFDACSRSKERDIPRILRDALEEANERVYAESRRSRKKKHMGSTAAVAAIVDGRLFVANVGDSRIYLIHGNNVRQLSMDHTWANEVVRSGRLSDEDASKHPRRDEIIRSIGYESSLDVDLGLWLRGGEESEEEARAAQGIPLQKGDRVLICSDGVTKTRHDKPGSHYVEEIEIPGLVEGRSPEQAVESILKQARSRKVDDNISAVILDFASDESVRHVKPDVHILAVALIVLLFVVARVWLIPQWLSGKSNAKTTSIVAELPIGVAYISELNGFAEKQTVGSNFKGLQDEEIIASGQDVRLRTLGEQASLRLDLADQSILYLGPDTQIELRSIADGSSIFETLIVLEQGSVLVSKGQEATFDFVVASPIGIQARAVGSLMGVSLDLSSQRFHVDCFHAKCMIEGILSYELQTGEHRWMAPSGEVSEVNVVRHELYEFGDEIIPKPTTVVQNTVVKITASPTKTLGPLFVPPTLTFTPPPTKTPKPPPTFTPTEPPTDTPEPTDTPGPTDTPEPTEPQEPTRTRRWPPPPTATDIP